MRQCKKQRPKRLTKALQRQPTTVAKAVLVYSNLKQPTVWAIRSHPWSQFQLYPKLKLSCWKKKQELGQALTLLWFQVVKIWYHKQKALNKRRKQAKRIQTLNTQQSNQSGFQSTPNKWDPNRRKSQLQMWSSSRFQLTVTSAKNLRPSCKRTLAIDQWKATSVWELTI